MKMKIVVLFSVVLIAVLSYNFTFMEKSNSKTVDNLKSAIIGETTASAKYLAYSKKAKEEGLNKIALLFEAASKSEGIHANNHRSVLEQIGITMEQVNPKYEVKTTKENLQDAINGESYEVATMYPDFIKTATNNNVNLAVISFNYAYQTEKKHKELYKDALDKLNNKKADTLPSNYFVCSTCGNTYAGEAPNRCGISMTPKDRFISIK
ncbi:MAG: ferritin family protein [Ignavibacteriaceae bacterium]